MPTLIPQISSIFKVFLFLTNRLKLYYDQIIALFFSFMANDTSSVFFLFNYLWSHQKLFEETFIHGKPRNIMILYYIYLNIIKGIHEILFSWFNSLDFGVSLSAQTI